MSPVRDKNLESSGSLKAGISNGMRLLVVTQAVDADDSALGFFHRWLEEFAPRFNTIEVICLKEGVHALPPNVHVHSLGKPASRLRYVGNFYRYIFSLHYDTVFVHMNEEYVLLGGLWWRLLGKRIVLWRNHKMGSWRTRLSVRLSDTVCYTSPTSFVASSPNAVQMPIGIDTEFFVPPTTIALPDTILLFGRLDSVKRCDIFFDALALMHENGTTFHADSYGDPTIPDDPYAREVKQKAEPLAVAGRLAFHSSMPNREAPHIYGAHAIYVNLTPSGSFDKTIGEAMACGCIVVCVNDAVRGIVRDELMANDGDARDVARALEAALHLSATERAAEASKLRAYIEEHHSLRELAARLEHQLRG